MTSESFLREFCIEAGSTWLRTTKTKDKSAPSAIIDEIQADLLARFAYNVDVSDRRVLTRRACGDGTDKRLMSHRRYSVYELEEEQCIIREAKKRKLPPYAYLLRQSTGAARREGLRTRPDAAAQKAAISQEHSRQFLRALDQRAQLYKNHADSSWPAWELHGVKVTQGTRRSLLFEVRIDDKIFPAAWAGGVLLRLHEIRLLLEFWQRSFCALTGKVDTSAAIRFVHQRLMTPWL